MKILIREKIQLSDKRFETFILDALDGERTFPSVVKKDLEENLFEGKIYTNGQIKLIRKEELEDEHIKYVFSVEGADWVLTFGQTAYYLYVRLGFINRISVDNEKLNEIVSKNYLQSLNNMIEKLEIVIQSEQLARKLDVPINIVRLFNGDEERIEKFILSVKKAIENCFGSANSMMNNLNSKKISTRNEVMSYMGIDISNIPSTHSIEAARYVFSCLEKNKIIGYND